MKQIIFVIMDGYIVIASFTDAKRAYTFAEENYYTVQRTYLHEGKN